MVENIRRLGNRSQRRDTDQAMPEERTKDPKGGVVSSLKGAPKAVVAAVVTAVIGAIAAYFVPHVLDQIRGENRLHVRLESNPGTIDTFADISHRVIVPGGRKVGGNPGPGCAGFYPWATAFGGVPAGESNFRLVVQGGGDQTLIEGIRARVLERDPPLNGTGFVCPTQGALRPRSVCINLDEPNPIGRVVRYSEFHKSCEGRPVSFTVAANETEVFDVSATTEACYCKWVLELVTTQGGEEKIVSVPGGGEQFDTTPWPASPSRPQYTWDPFGSQWSSGGTTYPPNVAELPALPTFEQGVRGGPVPYY
jgi:hypothetical protein